jgi:hypothetical protein
MNLQSLCYVLRRYTMQINSCLGCFGAVIHSFVWPEPHNQLDICIDYKHHQHANNEIQHTRSLVLRPWCTAPRNASNILCRSKIVEVITISRYISSDSHTNTLQRRVLVGGAIVSWCRHRSVRSMAHTIHQQVEHAVTVESQFLAVG